MKIYFIAHRINNPITGGEFYNEALLQGAKNAGLEVVKWEAVAWDKINNRALRIIALNFYFLIKSVFISKKDILIIDTDFHSRVILAIIWAKYILRTKIVGMLHLYCFLMEKGTFINKITFFMERFISRRLDYLITNSDFSYRTFQQLTENSIPYTILTPFSKDAPGQISPKVKFDSTMLRIIQVGTLEHRKNPVNTIEALALLDFPFTLSFVGHFYSSDYQQMLFNLIKAKRMENKIFFRGVADRALLKQYYLESNLFILVSRLESYGMVYAEAMQYGLPIIGSITSSVPELVTDGQNGYLCDPEKPKQIADAIRKINNKDEWERISANCYKKATDLMDKISFIKESSDLFINLTGKDNSQT